MVQFNSSPKIPENFKALIKLMCEVDPKKRPTVNEILEKIYYKAHSKEIIIGRILVKNEFEDD